MQVVKYKDISFSISFSDAFTLCSSNNYLPFYLVFDPIKGLIELRLRLMMYTTLNLKVFSSVSFPVSNNGHLVIDASLHVVARSC